MAALALAVVKYLFVPSTTASVFKVWKVLSPLKYCADVPAVIVGSLFPKAVVIVAA